MPNWKTVWENIFTTYHAVRWKLF